MTGLTSVTFRQHTPEQVIGLAAAAGLDGIEWGGDIHLPPGEKGLAGELAAKTAAAGLKVLSYGSYYRLGEKMEFLPVLETAAALGAPNIRIWAGTLSPAEADEAHRRHAAGELQSLCDQAAERAITISLEYHRGTLTETADSALSLIGQTARANLRTYWQPNPDISHRENCRELERILPYLSNVHVFQWKGANIRYPLAEGTTEWGTYLSLIGERLPETSLILEFVKGDSPEQFAEDAAVLKSWMKAE